VLAWIKRFARQHGHWPSIREAMDGLDMRSTNGPRSTFQALEKKGYMRCGRKRTDSWELVGYKFELVSDRR
jgi:SOS-response transcriptional repressor LexA